MDLSWWRDLVIVIWGIAGTLVLIIITIFTLLFYQRLRKTLDSADYVIYRAGEMIDYAEREVVKPLFQFGTLMQGIVQGVDLIANLFKKKEKENE